MTLQEYFNQREPQRMPKVTLQPTEYGIITSVKVGVDTLTLVLIRDLNTEYIQKNSEQCLYTTDKHGNPKTLSCFYMPEN